VTFEDTATSTSLIVPSHTFAPYNAQATIHMQQAHWALRLPFTVPGRVSDIWRSSFALAVAIAQDHGVGLVDSHDGR
jgi:hypothetical protein